MQQLVSLLEQYGLSFVFLHVLIEQAGVPLPAYPTLIVAGALVAHANYGVSELLLAAVAASFGSDELKALITHGTPVVDLRTVDEWRQTGVVKGSRLITLFDETGRADPAAWSRQVDKVAATDKPVVLICRSGSRCGTAAQFLEKTGHKGTVYNVKAGIAGWIREGQAVVSLQVNLKQAGISCSPSC